MCVCMPIFFRFFSPKMLPIQQTAFRRATIGVYRWFGHRPNVIAKRFSGTPPPPSSAPHPPPPASNLAWKIAAGGTLAIGIPWLAYSHYRSSGVTPKSNAGVTEQRPESKQIAHLPETVPYLIIGGGPAGFSAARTIRSNDPGCRVLIITDEDHFPYSRTPLTKELWFSGLDEERLTFKQFNGRERSIYFEHEEFYLPLEQFSTAEHGGVSVLKRHHVVRIDPDTRQAELDNGQLVTYGKCVLATGSRTKNLPVFATAPATVQEKVILYRTPEDYRRLRKLLPELSSLTIVGNGFTASELAFSLADRRRQIKADRLKINQVFQEDGVLDTILPSYLSRWCTQRIRDEDINVITNRTIRDVQTNKNNQLILTLDDGQTIVTDICVVDAGHEPNIELAGTSPLEVDPINGGFISNAEFQIRTNLWVAGDVASFYDQMHGHRRRDCNHDNAIFTGRLAGENATGGAKPYRHDPRFWSDLGADIGFEAIGLIDSRLKTYGVFARDDPDSDDEKNRYQRGVLFYLDDNNIIVGVVLWNIFDMDNMHLARQVLHHYHQKMKHGLNEKRQQDDIEQMARMFALFPSSEMIMMDDQPPTTTTMDATSTSSGT